MPQINPRTPQQTLIHPGEGERLFLILTPNISASDIDI